MSCIKAILIDPTRREVREIELATHAKEGVGPQIDLKEIRAHVGAPDTTIEFTSISKDVVMLGDENGWGEEGKQHECFQLGKEGLPIPGCAILVGNDVISDSFFDLPEADCKKLMGSVIFTCRRLMGFESTQYETTFLGQKTVGLRVEPNAPIVEVE
jgi:hypothetical protein